MQAPLAEHKVLCMVALPGCQTRGSYLLFACVASALFSGSVSLRIKKSEDSLQQFFDEFLAESNQWEKKVKMEGIQAQLNELRGLLEASHQGAEVSSQRINNVEGALSRRTRGLTSSV